MSPTFVVRGVLDGHPPPQDVLDPGDAVCHSPGLGRSEGMGNRSWSWWASPLAARWSL